MTDAAIGFRTVWQPAMTRLADLGISPGTVRAFIRPALFGAGVLALWEFLVTYFNYPRVILPAPSLVWIALIERFDLIWHHTVPTMRDSIAGFLIAVVLGVGFAAAITTNRYIRDSLYPLIITIQLVPKVAWTPLFIVWAGIGWESRMSIATFIAFFPILIAMVTGLQSTDKSLVRLCKALTASTWQTFWMVRLPASVPYFFSGCKIAITLAVIGVIVGEFMSSSEGIGFLILLGASNYETDLILASITVLCLMGLAFYGLVEAVDIITRRWMTQ
jgi:NitT/TauT family transport system permease protein